MKRGFEDMEMNAEMPLELKLDLLVDGELPEAERRELLMKLSREPRGPWRDLAVRFLERQDEKETVRRLMAGGRVVPVEWNAPVRVAAPVVAPAEAPAIAGRIAARLNWTLAVAAGLLLVATSAMVTFYLTQPAGRTGVVGEFHASLPPEVVSFDRSVPVTVPVVNVSGSSAVFPMDDGDPRFSKRSMVVQPAGGEKAMVIPVNTLKAAVY